MSSASFRTVRRRDAHGERERIGRGLVDEVPVALTYGGTCRAVMMCTPADLEDFAVGFSLADGIVRSAREIESIEVVQQARGVELRMWLSAERQHDAVARHRRMLGPVGCGLCGLESLEQVFPEVPRPRGDARMPAEDIARAFDALRAAQWLHRRTRAAHAAGLWDCDRGLVAVREDVGRHNALDKLAGALARAGGTAANAAVLLTSRVSVDLVQKVATLGAPILVAASAPTSLAVRVAEEAGLTMVCSARDGAFEIHTHPDRIGPVRPTVARSLFLAPPASRRTV